MIIVCGTDLSERSKPAERAALAIASRTGAELCLVYVTDPDVSALLAPTTAGDVRNAASARLDAHARELREAGEGQVTVVASVVSDAHESSSVAQRLVHSAVEQGAALLIVSSQGHGASPLIRIGGTSERVAKLSPIPVLLVRDERPFVDWARGKHHLRMLLGVDSSTTSLSAIEWAKQLRSAGPCDVTVGHVYYANETRRRFGVHSKLSVLESDPELERLLSRELEALVGEFPGEGDLQFQPIVGLGRLGDHLLSLADSETSELIVVGTHQKGGVGRLASVSSVVLHHGHAAVACIPTALGQAPLHAPLLRRVLVPTDLSAPGNLAVSYAYSLVRGPTAEVHLVHVMSSNRALEDQRTDTAVASQLRHLVPASELETATRTHVLRSDDIPRAVCELAERLGVDALCLSTKPHAASVKLLFGSVADRIARETPRPIFLVKPPEP